MPRVVSELRPAGDGEGEGARPEPPAIEPTTYMINGLDAATTAETLMTDLDRLGFAGSYDYLYLPYQNGGCKGYAFIDFQSAENGKRFVSIISKVAESPEVCLNVLRLVHINQTSLVKPAKIQGVSANLRNLWQFWRGMKPIHENAPLVRNQEGTMAPTLPWEQLRADHTQPKMDVPKTLCLRGIPNKVTSTELMDTLDSLGFTGEYDYFYLPCDIKSLCNRGYAFVNLMTDEAAHRFNEVLTGYRFQEINTEKRLQVTMAKVQGVRENLLRCQSVNCKRFLSKPWVLEDGEMKCLSRKADVDAFTKNLNSSQAQKDTDDSADSPQTESTRDESHDDSNSEDTHTQVLFGDSFAVDGSEPVQAQSLWSMESWRMASVYYGLQTITTIPNSDGL
jgi:hypothetical protein